jgi:NAD(P)-dependent dehydrogenase (short-subunit alcohol dehydrogenase family)
MRRLVLITGATSGLGLAMAAALASGPYDLLLTYRNAAKGEAVRQQLQAASPDAHIRMIELDLASFQSIENCATLLRSEFDWLDVLFNNAGLYLDVRRQTVEGAEMTLGVNYLGPYYLTRLLLPLLARSDHPQVIQMGSFAALLGHFHDRADYFARHPHGFRAYLDSKTLQLMMSLQLARELEPHGISVNAVHPGVVSTGLWRGNSMIMRLLRFRHEQRYTSAEQAARCGLNLIENPGFWDTTGQFYNSQGQPVRLGRRLTAPARLEKLQQRTDRFIREHGGCFEYLPTTPI